MKRVWDLKNDEELKEAQWQAARGAASGAAWWGIYAAVLSLGAYRYSPVYRNLTFQFKVYLQMSAMLLGGMIQGDKRLQEHEQFKRHTNRVARDAEVWRRYEADYAAEENRRAMMGLRNASSTSATPKSSEEVNEAGK